MVWPLHRNAVGVFYNRSWLGCDDDELIFLRVKKNKKSTKQLKTKDLPFVVFLYSVLLLGQRKYVETK